MVGMYKRLSVAFLILAACLMESGCHGSKILLSKFYSNQSTEISLAQARQALQDATPCCQSFADFSYEQFLPLRPQPFRLGIGSQVASLAGTRSYFLTFKLRSDVKLPYRVGLKSELNGHWIKDSYLLAPTVTLLDAGFQPIYTQDINLCEYMSWSSVNSGAFGSITVSDPKARYLVLYSSEKQQSSGTYWEQSPATFSFDTPTDLVSKGSFKVPHGPNGTIWIGLMTKGYAEAVKYGICGKPE